MNMVAGRDETCLRAQCRERSRNGERGSKRNQCQHRKVWSSLNLLIFHRSYTPKASDAQTRASAGFQHAAVESVSFSRLVTISLSAIVIYIFTGACIELNVKFPDQMMIHQAIRCRNSCERAKSESCQIYDILLSVTSKNCSKPLRNTVILTFSPTFLL